MAREIKEQDFDSEVLQAAKPVLVDFHATWCGPCQQQTPILEAWAEAKAGQVDVVKVDVDSASKVASRFGVMSIPTLILFKDGEECAPRGGPAERRRVGQPFGQGHELKPTA